MLRSRRRGRYEKHFHSPGFVYYTHAQPCIVRHCTNRDMQAAHGHGRGAGGTWRDIFPACRSHHAEQGTGGIRTFERKHDVHITACAALHATRWERMSDAERVDWEVAAKEAGYRYP